MMTGMFWDSLPRNRIGKFIHFARNRDSRTGRIQGKTDPNSVFAIVCDTITTAWHFIGRAFPAGSSMPL
jgi:hypothetical protein